MFNQRQSGNFYVSLDTLCQNFKIPRFVIKKWIVELKAPVQKRCGKACLPCEWVEQNQHSLREFQKEWLTNAY